MSARMLFGCFVVALLSASFPQTGAQQSPGLYFSHISWKLCMDSERGRGFYDPYLVASASAYAYKFFLARLSELQLSKRDANRKFPQVCEGIRFPGYAGFKLTTSFAVYLDPVTTSTALFQDLAGDIARYEADSNGCRTAGTCKITMLRFPINNGVPDTQDLLNERRIGFREGQGDASTLPVPSGGLPSTGDGSEKIACSSSPGGCLDEIQFVIDGVTRENPIAGDFVSPTWVYVPRFIIHAHFSFDHQFTLPQLGAPPKVYTVFFEGCCRPGSAGTHSLVLGNGKGTPWHTRTEVVIARDEAQYTGLPISSFKFEAQDIVQLPQGLNTNCQIKMTFFLQGFHPESEFESGTTYNQATANQMGLYKCREHQQRNNPESPLVADTKLDGSDICGFAAQYESELDWVKTGVEAIDGRAVDFRINVPGFRLVTVVAQTPTQVFGETLQPITLSTQVDFLVRVWETNNLLNDASDFLTNVYPTPFYDPNLMGTDSTIDNPAQPPSYLNPIKMECGKPFFMLNDYEEEYVRVRFQDADQGGDCIQGDGLLHEQKIDWIGNTHTFAYGAMLSQTITPIDNNLWDQYAELRWQPKCEDRSNVGRFLFCFASQDALDDGVGKVQQDALPAQFYPAHSISSPALLYSPFRDPETGASACCDIDLASTCCNHQQNPSCLFVEVEPPRPNPQPVINSVNNFMQPCLVPGVCNASTTCAGLDQSVVVDQVFQIAMFSKSENDLFPLDLVVSFEDSSGNPFPTPDSMNITKMYGCDGVWGAPGCTDQRERENHNDVALQITYAAPSAVPSDTFKICVQGKQILDEIDPAAWMDTWAYSPSNDTCRVCFSLVIVDKPSFTAETPARETTFDVRIGEDRSFPLVGRGRLNVIDILVLPDPGAPIGLSLGEASTLLTPDGRFYTSRRVFRFAPQVGQEGQVFRVCFVVRNNDFSGTDALYSDEHCLNLRVPKLTLGWSGVGTGPLSRSCEWNTGERPCCPTTAVLEATVGCTQRYDLVATKTNFANQLTYDQGYPFSPFFFVEHPQCLDAGTCPVLLSVDACAPGQREGCCGNGVCDGAETGGNCPADCEPDDATLETVDDTSSFQQGLLIFTPNRHQQGRTLLMCVGAEPAEADGGAAVIVQHRTACFAPSLCFILDVASCKYCVPEGKTLKSIARHYFLNVDWLRLYNSNPAVRDPDGLLTQQEIQVGPIYTVQPGDTLLSIAAKTRTTVRSLMENNPALPPDGLIVPDDRICVLVCSAA